MEKEEYLEDDDMKVSIFEIESEDAENFGVKDEEENDDDEEEVVDKSSDDKTDEDEKEDEDDSEEVADDDAEDVDSNDEFTDLDENEKLMATLIEDGVLYLPDDYEYEPTPEGIKQAFADSEAYRNESAFREAINFLLSKEGMDFVKVKQIQNEIQSIDVDNDDLSDNAKVELIKKFYLDKGYEEEDLEEKIEEIIDEDKIDKEFKIAAKYLRREKEKELEQEAQKPVQKVKEQQDQVEAVKRHIQKTLSEVNEIDGYTIAPKNKQRIFDAIYKPVKDSEGNVTTEFSYRLGAVLANPEKLLVLADILVNMTDKGYNFQNFQQVVETNLNKTTKRKIKDLSRSDSKAKVTGKNFQTKKEFDLSKASLFH